MQSKAPFFTPVLLVGCCIIVGSFAGVWLGGKMYDVYGDYTVVWWVGVGVGAFSALIHPPVNEKRSAQPA